MGVNLKKGYLLTQGILSNTADSPEQRAYLRDIFYYRKSAAIRRVLLNDMKLYDCDTADLSRMKPVLIHFIPEFIEKLCTLYDRPPLFEFGDSAPENDRRQLLDLLAEVRINNFLPQNFNLTRLHNTILACVRYHNRTDKIFLDSFFNQSNTIVQTYPDNYLEPAIVVYKTGDRFYVWDRENKEHYWLKDRPKFLKEGIGIENREKYPIEGNSDLQAPDYFPFVVYRYRDTGEFWGEGFDELIDVARLINLLYTITGDDAIQETIRLLILNFNPTGIEGESGHIKTGLKHPLFPESTIPGQDNNLQAQVVSADLYIEAIGLLIEDITDRISNIHSIPNVIKKEVQSDLSGIALRLKMQPILDRHQKDQNVMKYCDLELIKTIVGVHNYHRPAKRIDEKVLDGFQINYQTPEIIVDEKEEFELEKEKWEKGISNPVEYVMRKNPNFTVEEAKRYIKENLSLTAELISTKSPGIFRFRTNVE